MSRPGDFKRTTGPYQSLNRVQASDGLELWHGSLSLAAVTIETSRRRQSILRFSTYHAQPIAPILDLRFWQGVPWWLW
jgi:hypothetical protein